MEVGDGFDISRLRDIHKDEKTVKEEFTALGSLERLDKYCDAILLIFEINHDKELGFGELYRELIQFERVVRLTFTRPTLSRHLKHLVEKNILEVREEIESNLTIKPKKYRLREYWAKMLRTGKYKDYTTIMSEYEDKEIEFITYDFVGKSIDMCLEAFKESISINRKGFPTILGTSYYLGIMNYIIDNYGKIVVDRNLDESSSSLLNDVKYSIKQILNEKEVNAKKDDE